MRVFATSSAVLLTRRHSSRFATIGDAIPYRPRGIHQFLMAAIWRTLKERADRPAPSIERYNDVGRPVRTLIGVSDGVSALAKGARMTFVLVSGALARFFKRKLRAFVAASSKSCNQDQCPANARPRRQGLPSHAVTHIPLRPMLHRIHSCRLPALRRFMLAWITRSPRRRFSRTAASLHTRKGMRLAILTGASGSGKTAIREVVASLYGGSQLRGC